jgi:hypothetical protein
MSLSRLFGTIGEAHDQGSRGRWMGLRKFVAQLPKAEQVAATQSNEAASKVCEAFDAYYAAIIAESAAKATKAEAEAVARVNRLSTKVATAATAWKSLSVRLASAETALLSLRARIAAGEEVESDGSVEDDD